MNSFFLNFNGKLVSDSSPLFSASNRAFKYGDSLFESMKYSNGKIFFFDEHWKRFQSGVRTLKMNLPDFFTKEYLLNSCVELCGKNNLEFARIRLQHFRVEGGLYKPESFQTSFVIECFPLQDKLYPSNSKGLTICIYPVAVRQKNFFSNIKTTNAIGSVMASIHAIELNCDDALLLNADLNIAEATSANIFLFDGKQIITPSLTEGCLAGVMRNQVIRVSESIHIPVMETMVKQEILSNVEEVFLTNTSGGIKWVEKFEGKMYKNKLSSELRSELNKTAKSYLLSA